MVAITKRRDGIQQSPRIAIRGLLCCVILLSECAPRAPHRKRPPTSAPTTQQIIEQRHKFQYEQIITGLPMQWIFNPGDPPRLVWRDAELVRQMGGDPDLRVRWFDADLNETEVPKKSGRWGAWVESRAPNGTPVRRSATLLCRPPGFIVYFTQGIPSTMPALGGPINEQVWREHEGEIVAAVQDGVFQKLNDSEAGVSLIAGLSELKPTSRPALSIESAAVRNDDYHLALKMKVLALKPHPLAPLAKAEAPAPTLHEGTPREAGMRDDAKAKIDAICRDWASDGGEPFVNLVARHGVIVTHEAFGSDKGKPIAKDYRNDVFSITKSITPLLFARFMENKLIDLEAPVSSVFHDWPSDPKHVPTFRQCFTHMGGFVGHGEFGGCRNPSLDNILLNGIDANFPGKKYEYSGTGFDLAATAMAQVAGKSPMRLYYDELFTPLGIGDLPIEQAASGAKPTALQLATLAQLWCNHGRYADRQFFNEEVFRKLLPEDLSKRYPGVKDIEGIGIHFLRPLKPGADEKSTRDQDLIFSPHTIGHGSLSACIFLIDLDNDLVIAQIRRGGGQRYAEWSTKFYQAVADAILR